VKNYSTRQRYWARNMLGWHFFKSLQPNRAHAALSELEKMNKLNNLITQVSRAYLFASLRHNYNHFQNFHIWKVLIVVVLQNVDNLHQKAGNTKVLELHGSNYHIVCISCQATEPRANFQDRLLQANPTFFSEEVLSKHNRWLCTIICY